MSYLVDEDYAEDSHLEMAYEDRFACDYGDDYDSFADDDFIDDEEW